MATYSDREREERKPAYGDQDIPPQHRRGGVTSGMSVGILLAVLLLLGLVFWSSSNRPAQEVSPLPPVSRERTVSPGVPATPSNNVPAAPAAPAPATPEPAAPAAPAGR